MNTNSESATPGWHDWHGAINLCLRSYECVNSRVILLQYQSVYRACTWRQMSNDGVRASAAWQEVFTRRYNVAYCTSRQNRLVQGAVSDGSIKLSYAMLKNQSQLVVFGKYSDTLFAFR